MNGRIVALAGALMIAAAAPARADVKAGVDAWSAGDYGRAVAEWRPFAGAGNADAQFNLGQAYKLGRGVTADPAAATDWFRKAAAQGHAQAGDALALALYQAGDKAGALPWLEQSAARDEQRTELVLGTMLFNGEGTARDWPRAYALVARASQQGLAQGKTTLATMDKYIPADEREQGLVMAQAIAASGRIAAVGTLAPAAPPAPPALAPPRRAVATPTARPAPTIAAKAGGWAVQLGAFRDAGNARALWAEKGGAVGGTPAYVTAGALTRLLATGFASKAEAQRGCARAGGGCIVTPR